jgi:hypothetical protein
MMKKFSNCLFVVCACAALLPASSNAQASAEVPAAPTTAPAAAIADTIAAISNQLRDGESASVTQTVIEIHALLRTSAPKVVGIVRTAWLKRLMELQRYDDVLDLSLLATLAAPFDTGAVEQLQSARVQALLAQGNGPEALVAAKQLFDVSTLKGTADAIRTVCRCLNAVHPDDRDVLKRYRKEQIDGAQSDASPAATQPTMLSSIHVDPSPYEAAIHQLTAEDYRSLTGEGNLMLLAGNAKDAQDVFERAYTMASDKELAAASENLARCMKAEDGTIGRANAWVLSLRPKTAIASEPAMISGFAATQASSKER